MAAVTICSDFGQYSRLENPMDGGAWWAAKSLQMVTAPMKLKDTCYLKESYDQPKQHVKNQRHYFVNKGLSSQGYGFSSGHVIVGL